jgi:hypothetical protein
MIPILVGSTLLWTDLSSRFPSVLDAETVMPKPALSKGDFWFVETFVVGGKIRKTCCFRRNLG